MIQGCPPVKNSERLTNASFGADRPERFTQTEYDDRFVLSNPAGAGVTIKLCDDGLAPQDRRSANAPELELNRVAGAETIYLILSRDDVNDVEFSVAWESALSYLTLDTISLELNEETGPDWGADELELSVSIDGENVYSDTWDDADSDEDWPNLARDIRASVQTKVGMPVEWVPLSEGIMFSIIKTDGIFAHGSSVGVLPALRPEEPAARTVTGEIIISDPAGDGQVLIGSELRKLLRGDSRAPTHHPDGWVQP